MLKIKELSVLDEREMNSLRKLLLEYGIYMYEELKLTAGKDSFRQQMRSFPDESYNKPDGGFFLATYNDQPVACVGMRRFDNTSCEMKRMYVSSKYRGLKIGKSLCDEIIALAKRYGYKKILLDTNKEMKAAVDLYYKYGFREIPAYCENENEHPIFLELSLESGVMNSPTF